MCGRQINVSIFRRHCLTEISASMPCLKTPSFHHQFCYGSCFEHIGVRLNMDQGHRINNQTVHFVISSCAVSFTHLGICEWEARTSSNLGKASLGKSCRYMYMHKK